MEVTRRPSLTDLGRTAPHRGLPSVYADTKARGVSTDTRETRGDRFETSGHTFTGHMPACGSPVSPVTPPRIQVSLKHRERRGGIDVRRADSERRALRQRGQHRVYALVDCVIFTNVGGTVIGLLVRLLG
jgi:hypothetical protein